MCAVMLELEELKLISESLTTRCRLLEERTISTQCFHTMGDSMRKHINLYVLKNKIESEIRRLESE